MRPTRYPWPRTTDRPRSSQLLLAATALLFLGLSACYGWNVHTDYNHSLDMSRFKTYGWITPPAATKEAQFDRSLTGQRIRSTVERDLASKGIQPVAPGQTPDFKIAYRVSEKQKVGADMGGDWGYGFGPFMGGEDVYTYTEGTLLLDFVDPVTKRVFWRGAATKVLDNPDAPNPNVEPAVDKMLANYPPAPRG